MKKEVEIFLKRAESFIKDALEDLKRGDYDIAMFHIEIACQLIVKAKLLDLTGYFERTHSIRKLLKDLSKMYKNKEINDFIDKNWKIMRILEYSYIAGRYLQVDFEAKEVKEALKFYEELRNLLWTS